ncbi:hypothetical protein N7540_011402 [Penicillium herquei]|nr:hypothetical protein N7540_011402 [Penicillium herquei]
MDPPVYDSIWKYPVVRRPEGGSRIIGHGTTGIICQDASKPDQVIKGPLLHEMRECSKEVFEQTLYSEEQNREYFEREKLIYRTLPKDKNILDCIEITDDCIHFPYLRLGDLHEYIQKHHASIESEVRDNWIESAIDAVSLIHSFGVIHADISARNFLVADDMSIKMCDFCGSSINGLPSLVGEETRYCMAWGTPRSVTTDIFALGSLIFEITTGLRPYDEIPDEEWEEVNRRYNAQEFPSLEGNSYERIILKCWTSQYADAEQLKYDLKMRRKEKCL